MLGRATCVLVTVLASATVLAIAGAVQWQAPVDCPDQAAVEQRVVALLGRMPEEHELRAVGVVDAGPPWRLELETTIGGRRQQRTLEADECRALAEAAALVLAVSVDPLGTASASTAPPEREDEREDEPVVPEAPPVDGLGAPITAATRSSPSVAPTRARPRSLWLRVGAGGESGAVPGGTGGGRVGFELEGERGFVGLAGSYWVDRFVGLRPELPRRGATVGLGTVALHGGVHLGGPRIRVPLSLGLEAGGLRTRAVGLAGGRDLAFPWLAGVIGAGVHVPLSSRWALWGAVEGVLPLARSRVRVGRSDGGDEVLHELALCGVVVVPPGPGDRVYYEGIQCFGGCTVDIQSSVPVGLYDYGECLCDVMSCGDLVGGTTGSTFGDTDSGTTGEPDGCGPFPDGEGEFTCSCEMCSIDVTSVDATWIDDEADLPTICECMCGGAGCGSPV